MADKDDRGMDVADMKRLLTKSKDEPVNAAVALTGKTAVMMLHKIKAPRGVSKDLTDKFDDAKAVRWGTAFVDIEEDPKLVILTLNKGGGGLGQKLKKTLKGTGFSKVRIQLEDGTIDEDIGEDEEDQAEAGAAPAAAASWDPAEQTARLTGLVKQMMTLAQTAPDRVGELKQMATGAQAAIKAGAETAAIAAVDAFAAGLSSINQMLASVNGKAAPVPPAAVLQKSGSAWEKTCGLVEADIGKLKQALSAHYQGQAFAGELDTLFQSKTAPILTTLDRKLATALASASASTDAAQQQTLLGDARKLIDQYESFVGGNELLAQLDSNPFVPLQTRKTVTATLGALKKAIG